MTNPLRIQQLMKLVDLTRLNDQDDAAGMQQWLEQDLANAAVWPAAACVYAADTVAIKRQIVAAANLLHCSRGQISSVAANADKAGDNS